MEGWAKLITAIAALVGALTWPVAIVVLVVILRPHLRAGLADMPALFGRMQRVKLGAFEAELSAQAAVLVPEAVAAPGMVSAGEVRVGASLRAAAGSLGDAALLAQVDRLARDYDKARERLAPGYDRTVAMTDVLVRMRIVAPAIVPFLAELKTSAVPGRRLAALAIMQVDPGLADLDWLVERFRIDPPFLFFQAAAVLRALLDRGGGTARDAARAAAVALSIVQGYAGEPDAETVELLEAVAASVPR